MKFTVRGVVVDANTQFAGMLGHTKKEALRLHVWDRDAKHSREALLERVGSGNGGGILGRGHRRKDGCGWVAEVVSSRVERGEIVTHVRPAGRDGDSWRVRIEVEDHGAGISAPQRQRLFGAFEQADGSTARR